MSLPDEALPLPARLLRGATLLPNRLDILPHLPVDATIAELGVGFGDFSGAILQTCRPRHFVAIDNFLLDREADLWGQTPEEAFGGRTHLRFYEDRFAAPLASGQMEIVRGDSAHSLETFPDRSLDVIYVDADHRYEAVRRDLDVAIRKVRPDGWIIVNDYIMVPTLGATIPYGVVQATHEVMRAHDWGMRFLALHTRMFCDVALRPAHLLPDLASENAALRAEVAALRGSTSWRVTDPLRRLAGRVRRPPG